jgi:anti-anti-sigma factor
MNLTSEVISNVTVVRMNGDLDTNTSGNADAYLAELLENGTSAMLISLADVEYVSSAGLRVLLSTAKKLKASGGVLKLCGLNDAVQEVFEISGFIAILDVVKTEEDGLSAF